MSNVAQTPALATKALPVALAAYTPAFKAWSDALCDLNWEIAQAEQDRADFLAASEALEQEGDMDAAAAYFDTAAGVADRLRGLRASYTALVARKPADQFAA